MRQYTLTKLVVILQFVSMAACLAAEESTYTYGNRPIDLLPKSQEARPEDSRAWDEPAPPADFELALYTKDLFRVGKEGLERLCVVEARRPEVQRRQLALQLTARGLNIWHEDAPWVGDNQRMRPYWLPVRRGMRATLELRDGGRACAETPATLDRGAPAAMLELSAVDEVPAIDAGFALLPANEVILPRNGRLLLRVALPRPPLNQVHLEVRIPGAPPATLELRATDPQTLLQEASFSLTQLRDIGQDQQRITLEVMSGARSLAKQEYTLHLVDAMPEPAFGARVADLRYTLPIADGDHERTWDELWGGSDKRDVVVSFPGSTSRFVFWRGASYVACWALPEAWLTYEWLEAEPYLFGADDCVEPLQDRDCRYSSAEILSSTPARAVVKWTYALTDFQGKIIRNEHAEETFTFYPDGVGTRFLRGFYGSGWHENQEFIMVNRPGRRPSQALQPQALTFYNLQGDRQAPVWPKPGFSVRGWPQVITLVNIGQGPRPFMVTLDAPSQVKVWADPYLDKPDLFNSYPHWPVTRGMRTSWLDDPAAFARPTHSNLANLVNAPVRETETEKDFLWLIGIAAKDETAIAAAASWLQPGSIKPGREITADDYSQTERAYVLQTEEQAHTCEFDLLPAAGAIVNPAFIVKGWTGAVEVDAPGAGEVLTGQESGQLVIWLRGRFDRPTHITLRGK